MNRKTIGIFFAFASLAVACNVSDADSEDQSAALRPPPGAMSPPMPTAPPPGSAPAPGFYLRDMPGDQARPVENGKGTLKQIRRGPLTYDLAYEVDGKSVKLQLGDARFPVNPVAGARMVGKDLVVCVTGFPTMSPRTLQDIQTSCGTFTTTGTKKSSYSINGKWFWKFAERDGKAEVRFVPRVMPVGETEGLDCDVVDVVAGSFTPRATKAFCEPDRDPGQPCHATIGGGDKTVMNGVRDAKGLCQLKP